MRSLFHGLGHRKKTRRHRKKTSTTASTKPPEESDVLQETETERCKECDIAGGQTAHGEECSVPQGRTNGRKIHKDEKVERLGLTQLYPPDNDEGSLSKPDIDVVAIHGLDGHPIESWSSGDALWLRDFLPDQLVSAIKPRISTFGYNSRVAFCGSVSQIRDFALQLLNDLRQKRKETQSDRVPIVFVCHSLGGIVCKKSLIVAHELNDLFEDISSSTRGIVFMGTPHLGADVARWGSILGSIGNVLTIRHVRKDLLKDLQPKSKQLGEICMQFARRAINIKIVSIYERKKTNGIMVVDELSATLNTSNEHPVPVESNHENICKFSDPNSAQYRTTAGAITELLSSVALEENCEIKACLHSLLFSDYQTRRMNVSDKHEATFEWIWTHLQYKEWVKQPHSSLLWLQGKPASGKSTLTKFLCLEIRKRPPSYIGSRLVVVDFFYSDRGGEAQRDHIYMLRSILYQLLKDVPALWEFYVEEYAQLDKEKEAENNLSGSSILNWDVEALKKILEHIAIECQLPLTIYIVIDAMDESEETKREEILRFLTHLCTKSNEQRLSLGQQRPILKIFVASRPAPRIESALGGHLMMKLEDETEEDIRQFVRSEIQRVNKIMQMDEADLSKISIVLMDRADGVFLWVRLVISELEVFAVDGCTVAEIERLLESLPKQLHDLYDRILRRVTKNGALDPEAKSMFNWALFSWRPLTLLEMREAMAATACHPHPISKHSLERNRVINEEQMRRRLASKCGGLLEVKCGDVQVIHQTVREFLLKQPSSSQFFVAPEWDGEPAIYSVCNEYLTYFNMALEDHLRPLKEGCQSVINGLSQFFQSLENVNLIKYIVDGIDWGLDHYERIASIVQLTKEEEDNYTELLRVVKSALRLALNSGKVEDIEFIFYFDWELFSDILGRAMDSTHAYKVMVSRDLAGKTALHLAAEKGHQRAVLNLLDLRIEFGKKRRESHHLTTFHLAMYIGQDGSFEAIHALMKPDLEFDQSYYESLQLAQKNNHTAALQITTDNIVNLGANLSRALQLAQESDHDAEMQILRVRDDIKQLTEDPHVRALCLLCVAETVANESYVHTFLDTRDQLTEQKDRQGRTPLHVAILYERPAIVFALLYYGAAKTAVHDAVKKSTPLHLAASIGNEVITELLLEHGADRDVRDRDGLMPVHLAAKHGHEAVRALLQVPGWESDPAFRCTDTAETIPEDVALVEEGLNSRGGNDIDGNEEGSGGRRPRVTCWMPGRP